MITRVCGFPQNGRAECRLASLRACATAPVVAGAQPDGPRLGPDRRHAPRALGDRRIGRQAESRPRPRGRADAHPARAPARPRRLRRHPRHRADRCAPPARPHARRAGGRFGSARAQACESVLPGRLAGGALAQGAPGVVGASRAPLACSHGLLAEPSRPLLPVFSLPRLTPAPARLSRAPFPAFHFRPARHPGPPTARCGRH